MTDVHAARRYLWAAAVASAVASLGCADAGPKPIVTAVRPVQAYSDVAIPLTIEAPGLRAGLFVDVTGQTASFDDGTVHAWLVPNTPGLPTISLDPVRWHYVSPFESDFRATVPAAITADLYAVRLQGPNGQQATLPNAFRELGPDKEVPTVSLGAPVMDQTIQQGTAISAVFSADDGVGQLVEVRLETDAGDVLRCPADVDPETGMYPPNRACTQMLQTPALPDDVSTASLGVTAVGVDIAGNIGRLAVPINVRLAHLPIIDGLTPTSYALEGGAPLTVEGRYFLDDARVFIGNVELADAVRASDTIITGVIPRGARPEALHVEVRTAAGASTESATFRYVGPPRIRLVHPTIGPTGGGIKMTIAGNDLRQNVKIKFGTSLADAVELTGAMYEADDKVTGCLPPGRGTVTVWASDPITGDDHLDAAFTYTDATLDPASVVLCDSPAPPPASP